MDDPLDRALSAAFPDRAVAGVETPEDSAHPGNRTVRVAFEDGTAAFLKVRTDDGRERNAREAAVTRYARAHCDVRVPAVLAADSESDPPYLALAPLAGTPVSDRWDGDDPPANAGLCRAVGRAVGGVAAAEFDRPGRILGGDADSLDVVPDAWSEVLADDVERRARDVPYDGRFPDAHDRAATVLRERADLLDGADAALLHADLRRENILLAESGGAAGQTGDDFHQTAGSDGDATHQTAGILDWEWSLVGDPALLLCWAEDRVVEQADVPEDDRDDLRAAVRDGYRSVAGTLPEGFDRRRPVYRVVTFLPTVRSFHLWAPDAPEPTEDLAAWVGGEFEARIAAAREA